jgi:hypothetical protein
MMSSWDTTACQAATERMRATGLFNEEELRTSHYWLEEYAGEVFASPNKTAEMTGYTGTYLQWLCKEGKIDCRRDIWGWWKIPVDEIIELKKRKLSKG